MFNSSGESTFFIKGGDDGFANRQKSIFDQLSAAETTHNIQKPPEFVPPRLINVDVVPYNARVRSNARRNITDTRQFQGKDSIFKRPDALPPRFKTKAVPDYHKNPHKWVKYSLGDVSQDDMSDRSNSAAAFSFLQEIAARKAAAEIEDNMEHDADGKVAFRRPKPKSRLTLGSVTVESTIRSNEEEEKPSFRSSKLVMPEYVVGQTKRKEHKKVKVDASQKVKEIQLGHLVNDEDDS